MCVMCVTKYSHSYIHMQLRDVSQMLFIKLYIVKKLYCSLGLCTMCANEDFKCKSTSRNIYEIT